MATIIGVIAGTRGRVPEGVLRCFHGVRFIVHCGGIGGMDVVERLSAVAPVTGVVSRTDRDADCPFDPFLVKRIEGLTVLALHRIGRPARVNREAAALIAAHAPDVILWGEGGAPVNERWNERLLLNPGHAAPARGAASIAILEVNGTSARGRLIPLA